MLIGTLPSMSTTPVIAAFVHPGLAIAAVGLSAVPILIHLWNRRRHRPVRWAAMAFLLAAYKRSTRRLHVEQYLLLALRCAIVILFGLAIARPVLSRGAWLGGTVRRHHVLVIDNSFSMQAPTDDGRTNLARSLAAAQTLIERIPPADPVTIITASDPPQRLEVENFDRARVIETLGRIPVSFGSSALAAAARAAVEVIESRQWPAGATEVYVLSDDTRMAWAGDGADGSRPWTRDTLGRLTERARLHVVASPPARRDNVALVSTTPKSRLAGAGIPMTVEIAVENFGRAQVSDVRVQVLRDGELAREIPVRALDAGERETFEVVVSPHGDDGDVLEARLVDHPADALPEDDRRLLAISPRRRAPMALFVDGQGESAPFGGDADYIVAAVRAVGGAAIETRVISAADVPAEPLDEPGLFVLCNVRRLEGDVWAALASRVRDGAALLIFGGEQVDVDAYGRDAADLLPAILDRPAGLTGEEDSFVRIRADDLAHPAVAGFADAPECSLFQARIERYHRLRAIDGANPRTILTYDNGDAAFMERSVGDGVVILCTTTANMRWTNLPAKGDYVSLLWDLVGYAWPTPDESRNVRVGQTLSTRLGPEQTREDLQMSAPDGSSRSVKIESRDGVFYAIVEEAELPGEYLLTIGEETERFAVNVDPGESDLAPIDEPALRLLLGEDCNLAIEPMRLADAAASPTRREFSWMMLYAVFTLLIVESFLSMRFGHHA